jgi:DNA segregation ATPase FtsK/SpoIIIE, S-DNA-T family
MPKTRRYSKTASSGKPVRKAGSKTAGKVSGKGPSHSPVPHRSPVSARPSLLSRVRKLLRGSPARSSGKPAPATRSGRGTSNQPIPSGLSLDRKLDLIGVLLVFVGLPTILALFSANRSTSTGNWLNLLGQLFGWGAYIFPVTLVMIGLWLILRNFERVPRIALERLFGLGLFFVNLLVIFHFFLFTSDRAASYGQAAAAQGGGYLGATLYELLRANLGVGGTAIALLAWLVIALSLTLDVTPADLFRWLPPLVLRLQDAWEDFRSRRKLASSPAVLAPNYPGGPVKSGTSAVAPQEGASQPASPFIHQGSAPITWKLPQLDQILEPGSEVVYDDDQDRQRARLIEETLASFGAPVNVIEINRGPTITQFGVEPDFVESRTGRMRVRVGKIASLADDLALALSARTIRVQAPVPGKGFVGIEVPNENIARVALKDVIESEAFRRLKTPLRFALGQDVAGNAVAADLGAMPHLLIAGATGTGKSVCVNAIISGLLLHNTPDDLRLIMVDPKRVELTGYNGIPHLLAPVVVEMERVVGALQWVLREMDNRYHKLAQVGTRNITEYNAKLVASGEKPLPRLVVIIDELADLMIMAPDETERTITRLAQLARATGIHVIISTQRPSVDVVTGLIKANFPARIAFAVASGVDSRVVLDQPGAERLLGRGDMLFQAPDAPAALRIQGAWVSEEEINRVVIFWRMQSGMVPQNQAYTGAPVDALPAGVPLKQIPLWDEMQPEEPKDVLYDEALDLVRRQGRASISMLQRRLRIGYTRSARLIESMQEKGAISSEAGPQGFEVLDYGSAAPPVDSE